MHLDTPDPQDVFEEAFDNRSPQAIVADATYQRGYRNGFTNEQFLARQVLKMQEELMELSANIVGFVNDTDLDIYETGLNARVSFNKIKEWKCASIDVFEANKNNGKHLRKEIADMQVVLFNMATVIEEITRQPFDVVQAAVDKAKQDVKRGVR